MSYLVLARKWRPLTFDTMVGQEHVCRTLKNAVRSGRVAQAYLFTGSRGVGKTSAARILAKCLNCDSGPTPDPCNECMPCQEITAGTSFDVNEIDGASNTSVDDIRELREHIKYMPRPGKRKIYIIDEVHMLSKSAFNALLKTLEEPPKHVVFIFATTEPHKIPETILSRCQRYDFKRIPQSKIQERLRQISSTEAVNISDHALWMIAKAADGSMRDAQSLLDQMISYRGHDIRDQDVAEVLGIAGSELFLKISGAVLAQDTAACIKAVDDAYRSGIDFAQCYKDLVEHFRDLLVARIMDQPSEILDLPESHLEELKRQGKGHSIEDLQRLLSILIDAEDYVLRSGIPKVGLEVTLVKMARVSRLTPLQDILKKIESIQSAITNSAGVRLPSRNSVPAGDNDQASTQDSAPCQKPIQAAQRHEQQIVTATEDKELSGMQDMLDASEDADQRWIQLLEAVEAEHPALAAQLKNIASWELSETALTVFCPQGSFTLEKLKRPDSSAVLAKYAQTYFGRDRAFVVCPSPQSQDKDKQGVDVRADIPQQKNHDRIEHAHTPLAIHAEAIAHSAEAVEVNPAVKTALEIFGGSIRERRRIDQDGDQ